MIDRLEKLPGLIGVDHAAQPDCQLVHLAPQGFGLPGVQTGEAQADTGIENRESVIG